MQQLLCSPLFLQRKRRILLIVVLMLIGSILEVCGIGLIFPFIASCKTIDPKAKAFPLQKRGWRAEEVAAYSRASVYFRRWRLDEVAESRKIPIMIRKSIVQRCKPVVILA